MYICQCERTRPWAQTAERVREWPNEQPVSPVAARTCMLPQHLPTAAQAQLRTLRHRAESSARECRPNAAKQFVSGRDTVHPGDAAA